MWMAKYKPQTVLGLDDPLLHNGSEDTSCFKNLSGLLISSSKKSFPPPQSEDKSIRIFDTAKITSSPQNAADLLDPSDLEPGVFADDDVKKPEIFSPFSSGNSSLQKDSDEKLVCHYRCAECQLGFCHPGNLKRHLFLDHKIEAYKIHRCSEDRLQLPKCKLCDKSFNNKLNLDKHIQTHIHEGLNTCPYCREIFMTPACLKRHLVIRNGHHNKDLPHFPKCELCNKSFNCETNLEKHIQSTHLSNHLDIQGKNEISIFLKEFRAPRLLTSHVAIRNNRGRFTCQHCPKFFRSASYLKQHLRTTHNGTEDPFKKLLSQYRCADCQMSFCHPGNLKRHLFLAHKVSGEPTLQHFKHNSRSVSNSMPQCHNCQVCSKSFDEEAHLKRHMSAHQELLNVDSDLCPKRFVTDVSSSQRNGRITIRNGRIIIIPSSENPWSIVR